MDRRPATWRRVGLLAVAALLGSSAAALPAAAAESYARQETFTVSGHGWGHGRGMSQHGALGAAQSGLTHRQIVGFYYAGTTPTAGGNPDLRVLLSGDHGLTSTPSASLDVHPSGGLRATDVSTGRYVSLGAGPDRWRVVRNGAGTLNLQGRTSGVWRDHGLVGVAGPIQFANSGGILRRWYPGDKAREYRGTLLARTSGSGLAVVNNTHMEPYLRSVVPVEMPASWHGEALRAQSIAARSYSHWKRADARSKGQPWDICDSTQCQVYGGRATEQASTDAAVAGTAGLMLTYGGKPAFTEFSSSNGGWTVAGSVPYQVAKRDPYDGVTRSAAHAWNAVITAGHIERRFPALGRLVRLSVLSRDGNGDWGGRVLEVQLEGRDSAGRATSVRTTGREIYLARPFPANSDGLRSNWWTIRPSSASTPFGSLDVVASDAAGEVVRGWAIDPDISGPIKVHVHVNGRVHSGTTANLSRPDVGRAFPDHGPDHGFHHRISLPDGRHKVCAYAINAPGTPGTNKLLGCRDITVRHVPFGSLDAVTTDGSGVTIRGWAADPDVPTSPIKVHLHVDGRVLAGTTADRRRDDVARVYPHLGPNHGYGLRWPVERGFHTVCAYAINASGTAGSHRLLGCRNVTV